VGFGRVICSGFAAGPDAEIVVELGYVVAVVVVVVGYSS